MPSEDELTARTNYCRMMGHDFHIVEEEGEFILRCRNQCRADNRFKLVHRDA